MAYITNFPYIKPCDKKEGWTPCARRQSASEPLRFLWRWLGLSHTGHPQSSRSPPTQMGRQETFSRMMTCLMTMGGKKLRACFQRAWNYYPIFCFRPHQQCFVFAHWSKRKKHTPVRGGGLSPSPPCLSLCSLDITPVTPILQLFHRPVLGETVSQYLARNYELFTGPAPCKCLPIHSPGP